MMLTDGGTELRTEEEAGMGLSRYELGAGLAEGPPDVFISGSPDRAENA
jgi:hypothetical protein